MTDTRSVADAKPENPIDLYSAIIYTYMDANDKDWYIANVGKMHFETDSATSLDNLGLTVGDQLALDTPVAITGWQTVPEPTSGLRLILGVAGLALRCRRA